MVQKRGQLEDRQDEGLKNIQEQYKCKITVLHKEFRTDFYQQFPYGIASECGRLEEGQVFITDNRWDPPEGFCQWAWRDLTPIIQSIHGGHVTPLLIC